MLKIRLRRIGRTHEPFYRIVVTEETAPIQGKFLAQIGHYNPKTKDLTLQKEEAAKWMNNGAKPSNTVAKLMKKEKMTHKSIVIHKTRSVSKKELEAIKAAEEAEKIKEQSEKEAAKEAWEKESAEIAESHESSDEKLVETTESTEEAEKTEEATPETPTDQENLETEDK